MVKSDIVKKRAGAVVAAVASLITVQSAVQADNVPAAKKAAPPKHAVTKSTQVHASPQKSMQQMLDDFDSGRDPLASGGQRAARSVRQPQQRLNYGSNGGMSYRGSNMMHAMPQQAPRGSRNTAMLEKLRQQIVTMRQGQQPLMNMMQQSQQPGGMPGMGAPGGMGEGGQNHFMQMLQQKMQGAPQGGAGGPPGMPAAMQGLFRGGGMGGGMNAGTPAPPNAPAAMGGLFGGGGNGPKMQGILQGGANGSPGAQPSQSQTPASGGKFGALQHKLDNFNP